MEYYFDRDDRLERQKYAEFLKTLLLNCDKYRREDSDGAYVIALDSPWGTGKTRFVKMLRNELEGNKPRIVNGKVDRAYTPKLNKDRLFNVVYYNAWDTDFSIDALEPLFYSLLKSPELAPDQFDAAGKEILKRFITATKEVLKATGYALANHLFGEVATSIIKAGVDGAKTEQPNPYENYEKRLKLIAKFRTALTAVINATKQRKLVIIIDELDRCRPTFAIETLEIAKHLFAVDNVAFIFALDIEQLSHSAKTLYGTGMNTSGYLCRFFDSVTKLSVPDMKTFISELLTSLTYYKENQSHFLIHNAEFLARLSEIFDLSLRDITTIVAVYKCMLTAFLNEYKDYFEHQAYLFFLVIKYKSIALFNEIFTGTLNETSFENDSVLKKRMLQRRDLQSYLNALKDETIMRNGRFQLVDANWKQLMPDAKFAGPIERESNGKKTLFLQFVWEQQGSMLEFDIEGEGSIRWNGLIFKNDFYRWEEMKGLTIKQYIYRQLEMFDFVLPADEAKAEP